jgi:drug/metabolite transporter (DMT)-like permease
LTLSNDALATILILISAVLHAVVNSLIRGKGGDVLGRSVVAGVANAAVAPAVLFVPFPSGTVWMFLGASIVVHLAYQHCLIEMYRRADLTVVYPIARGLGPLGVALWSWGAMSVWPGWGSFSGVALIVAGIFMMALAAAAQRKSATAPPLSAFLFAAGTGVGIATYTLIDAAGVRAAESTLSYIVWLFLLHGGMMVSYGLVRDRAATLAALKAPPRRGLIAGVSSIFTYGLALVALRIGDTAELAALRETSIVFALMIGAFLLQERVGPGRILAAMTIAIGAIVIKAA